MIEARLPDGTTLRFPDGTADDVIDRTVAQHIRGASQGGRGYTMGRFARDAIEGLASFPSAAVDAITGQGMSRGLLPRETTVPTLAERASQGADALGLPTPQTRGERLTSAAVQGAMGAIPTMGVGLMAPAATASRVMLAGNPVSQIAAGAAGGLASQEATEMGAGPLAALAAGMAGGMGTAAAGGAVRGAGRAMQGIAEPFTQAGRERIAADVLMRQSADPRNLPQRIIAGLDDPNARLPDAPVTPGVAARDNGMMVYENALRGRTDVAGAVGPRSPAVALRDMEARRNLMRETELTDLGGGGTPESRGQAVRAALRWADEMMGERVDRAFTAARASNAQTYSIAPVREAARNATRIFNDLGGGVPAPLQGVLDDLARIETMTLDGGQSLRARLGAIESAAMAGQTPDRRIASAAVQIRDAIDNTLNDPRLAQAITLRREQGQHMGRNEGGVAATGAILRPAEYGMPRLDDPAVMRQAMSSPQAARQVLEAGYRALDDARRMGVPTEQLGEQVRAMRTAMRDHFLERALAAARATGQAADSAGNVSAILSPAGFQNYMRDNARMIPELFEPGQIRRLNRLVNDFAESSLATSAARARGSDTTQNLSVGNLLARASNGLLDPGSPGWQTVGSVAGLLRPVFAASEGAVQAMLTQAVTDPRFAAMLLQRASPANVRRAAAYIEQNMTQRLAEAATTAALRQGVRTAAEQQQPQ